MEQRGGRLATVSWLSLYVHAVMAAGFLLLAWRLTHLRLDNPLLFLALLGASLLISVSKVRLPLANGRASLSMSYFTDFMAIALMGPDAAMLVAGASGATQCLVSSRRSSARQTLFSVAALVLTVQAAGLASSLLGGFPLDQTLAHHARSAVAAAIAFFLCNTWLVAGAVALSRGENVLRTWNENFLWTAPACFIGAGVAVVGVRVVLTSNAWVVLLVAAPLYLTYRSYRVYLGRVEDNQQHLQEVSELHLASVEALARAIDARDQTIIERSASPNDNHIRRVQATAEALAKSKGMAPFEIEGVKVAALLHDIGKLAVPEHILTKPGRLTPDEFDRIRIHPVIGAQIIRAVPFPYPVAPLIHSHHERWDGSGYPDGLKGEAIPLGARVLAVVDYFDALTTDRPYHAAMAKDEAIAVLRAESGKALEPDLVERFIALLPGIDLHDDEAPAQAPVALSAGTRASAPVTGFSSETEHASSVADVFQNISRATQEMHALYDIAQTLGTRLTVHDTMALLASKLNPLVPASCWALYLYDPEHEVLQCRFASGLAREVVDAARIPLGEGASGWAARHWSPAVNARAGADFEAAGLPDAGRGFASALAYPLIDGEVLVGTLTIYHVDENPHRIEHRRLLDRVCNQVASVIRNSVLFEQMHQVSLTDSLTDLPNSRALFQYLADRFRESRQRQAQSALLMIDLDHFKAINDEHGHQVGDAALRQVADALRLSIRQTDFCARYAGDEFVVVLADCSRREAEARAEQIQAAIESMETMVRPGVLVRASVSVGVAISPEDGDSYEDLLTAADRRMYFDKQRRRARQAPSGSVPIARRAAV